MWVKGQSGNPNGRPAPRKNKRTSEIAIEIQSLESKEIVGFGNKPVFLSGQFFLNSSVLQEVTQESATVRERT